jgi:quinol monooxygenase YgiN
VIRQHQPAAKKEYEMVSVGLLIRLWAKPGQEAAVAQFLEGAVPIVDQETGTSVLFAMRMGPSEFGIFNAFPDDASRQAHISGHAAQALFEQGEALFSQPPSVEPVDIIGTKLPSGVKGEPQPIK